MDENNKEIAIPDKKDLSLTIEVVKQVPLRKYIEKDNIVEIIENMDAGRDKMLLMTMWMTGLRVSEINSIRKTDIDFKNNLMTVRWLKNRKFSERIIPIKKELSTILELYTTGMKWDQRIFHLTRQSIFYIVKKYINDSPHCLRHSFAVNFLRQSQNPIALVILQKLLGHSNIQTTMEYLRLVPMDMAIELEKVSFN